MVARIVVSIAKPIAFVTRARARRHFMSLEISLLAFVEIVMLEKLNCSI